MPQMPNRLQPDTPLPDNLALINDNFDKAVQDIGDLGARFTSVVHGSVTVLAGKAWSGSFGVVDPLNNPKYVAGLLQIVPRGEMWVTNDGNDSYLWGYSNSVDTTKHQLGIVVQRRQAIATLATYTVMIQNLDVSDHTYYYSVDVSYVDSPSSGYFR